MDHFDLQPDREHWPPSHYFLELMFNFYPYLDFYSIVIDSLTQILTYDLNLYSHILSCYEMGSFLRATCCLFLGVQTCYLQHISICFWELFRLHHESYSTAWLLQVQLMSISLSVILHLRVLRHTQFRFRNQSLLQTPNQIFHPYHLHHFLITFHHLLSWAASRDALIDFLLFIA
jgi:hypothetical protein